MENKSAALQPGIKGFVKSPVLWAKTTLNFAFWQKFSKALLSVVAAMPAAGILISVGRLLSPSFWNAFGDINMSTTGFVARLGSVLENSGWWVLTNLGFLFALSIANTWTNENKGGAVFTAAYMYLMFHAVVYYETALIYQGINGWTTWFDAEITIIGSSGIETEISNPAYLGQSFLGFTTLKGTQILSGIIIGFTAPYVYDKYHDFDKLPQALSFFNGKRFVPLVSTFYGLIIAFWFALLWPWVSKVFFWFGTGISEGAWFFIAPFLYGTAERLLLPFGLHHMITMPMNYGVTGGTYVQLSSGDLIDGTTVTTAGVSIVYGQESLWFAWTSDVMWIENSLGITGWESMTGEELALAIEASDYWATSPITYAQWSSTLEAASGESVEVLCQTFIDTVPARFKTGQVVISTAILPAAAIAMLYSIPKENRKQFAPMYISAATVVFICGITEPVEFMFCFTAPILYVIYAVLSGLAFAFVDVMNLIGAEIRVHAFGMIDFISKSPIFFVTSLWKDWLWFWAYSAVFAGVSFLVFYAYVKKFKPMIPGMVVGAEDNRAEAMASEMLNMKSSKGKAIDPKVVGIVAAYGGADNIKNVDACMTRLRVELKDASKFDSSKMKSLGATGTIVKGNATQSIFGGQADVLKSKVKAYLEDAGAHVTSNTTYTEAEAKAAKKADTKKTSKKTTKKTTSKKKTTKKK